MDIREFKNIYKEYAPSLIWDWCAKPSAEEIDSKLCEFAQMGICRVFIRPSKGLVLPYLSEDYFELIRTAARRSGKYGISLGICDENSPASGVGGGEITSVADYRMRDIVKVNKKDIEKTDEIVSEDSDCAVVLRDMSRIRNSMRMPLADITNAFVTECFTDAVYDKYIRQCKRFIGIEITEFMTDIYLPSDSILYSAAAQKKLGLSDIKALSENDGSVRARYFEAFSQCVADNYTGFLSKKCRENGLELAVCVDASNDFCAQTQYAKADSICLKVDSENIDYVALMLAHTVSEQFEKPFYVRLLLPSFSPCSQRYNKAAFMMAMGADKVIFDSVAFSLSDRRKYEKHSVAVSKFAEKDISNRLSRLSFVSSNTSSPAKMLIIYSPESKDVFDTYCEKLLRKGVLFHIVHESFFKKYAAVSPSEITVGGCKYTSVAMLDNNYPELNSFTGEKIIISGNTDITESTLGLSFDNEVIINNRFNGDDQYIFVTACKKDTAVIGPIGKKKLFAADFSNGEIYQISGAEGEYRFTIKAGKTAMLIYSGSVSADIAPPFTDDIEFAPHTKQCDVPFALSAADENILPLKNVNACFGRKSYRENSIDNLHKEFYALADGETVKVKYPFTADLKSIGQVKAYIENAENLDFIELNGKRLGRLTPSDKDPRFMGIDITSLLADGKNTFAVEYKKSNNYTPDFASITPSHFYSYNITSFEPIYLCGDFDCNENSLIRLNEYNSDITLSGMAYYYGSLTYALKLPESNLSGNILSVHGDFDICRIRIGKRSHTFFCETPMFEVFNLDCDAVAEITVYNTPFNLLRTSKEKAKPFGVKSIELCKFSY